MITHHIQLQVPYLQSIYLMLQRVTERRSGDARNLYFRLRISVGLPDDLTSDFYTCSFPRHHLPTPPSRIQNVLISSHLTRQYISYAVESAPLNDLKINEFRTQLSASCIFSEEFSNVVLWPRRVTHGMQGELLYWEFNYVWSLFNFLS